MIAVDEESADGLSAVAEVRTLRVGTMEARDVPTVVFKWCRYVIKVAGEASHSRVQSMQNRGASGFTRRNIVMKRCSQASHHFKDSKTKRPDLEALDPEAILGRDTLWVTVDTFGSTLDRLHDRKI